MKTNKILLVVRWPVGGIRTFINYAYSNWPDASVELHILTPSVKEVEIMKEQLTGITCNWHIVASEKPKFTDFVRAVSRAMRENKFDIVHAHGFTSALATSLLLPFARVASVFTSHDVLRDHQFSGITGICKKILIPLALNRFDIIHSVSNDADENLKSYLPLVDRKKCHVISNGIDSDRYYESPSVDLRATLGIDKGVYVIGFFGRFMSQKGFKYLVAAMEILDRKSPNKFQVICFGSGGFIREEKALLIKLKLDHLFTFHDFVADTAPFMKGCDVVVMPSLWEACPLLPMEVLAAGVPLVATSCIGLREVCKGSPTIIVEPANADALVEGVLALNESTKHHFKEYAEVARDRFNIGRVKNELRQLYEEITRR